MRLTLRPGIVTGAVFGLLILVLLAGCGKSGGGGAPTVVDPNVPVIADLVGTFVTGSCTTAAGAGTPRRLTFSYTDADGNVSGGKATGVGTFTPGGTGVTVQFSIPSGSASITGTTSGTITLAVCITFGGATTLTESVTLTDAAGNVSNQLTLTTSRPAGLPLLPASPSAPAYDLRS